MSKLSARFHYVVVLSHGMDDIPVRLFEDSDEAIAFADKMPWEPDKELLKRLDISACNTPCTIHLLTFENGEPISDVVLRDFEKEEDMEGEEWKEQRQ